MSDLGSLAILHGMVIDPSQNLEAQRDLLIENGRIVELAETGGLRGKAGETIDAKGLIVAPGFIDPHVHLQRAGTGAQGNHCQRHGGGGGRRIYLRLRDA